MVDDSPSYYWAITERDGTITRIPPDSVQVVQKRWDNGDPIHTSTRSIPAQQIVSFRITGERYSDHPLLEAAAQAFKEPIATSQGSQKFLKGDGTTGVIEYEAIQGRWVKSIVPMERWQRYYSNIPSYKLVGEQNGMAVIAFILATHDIDVNKTEYCTDDEVARLTKG